MIVPRPIAFATLVTALLAGVATAQAQEEWLVFYPVTGEVILSFEGDWQSVDGDRTFREYEFEETLRLQFGGYSLDPRIFNFNLNLEPVLNQTFTKTRAGNERSDGTFLNYNGRFSLLHGTPVSPLGLNGYASGSSDDVDGSLGTSSDITTENLGADLTWKLRPFRSTLSYAERSLDETFFSGPPADPVERKEHQKTVQYRGKSTKMELFLEGIDFDDQTPPPPAPAPPPEDQDYQSGEGRLSNYFRWGKGSRYTSRLGYYTREGFNAYDRTNVDQDLHLQHLDNLYTEYSYSYERLDRTVDTISHRGDFELNHDLYTNLNTSFRANGSWTESDQFEEEVYESTIDFRYRKEFNPDLTVTANLGGGYKLSDRSGGQLDFSESRVVDVTGIVLLTQRYIITSTIIVTAPGCNPCTEGLDYIVEPLAGDQTQLRIPGGSRINIGDVIDIDYTYAPPTAKYYGIPYRIGASVDYKRFVFYHRTGGETQNFISGPDPDAVGDQRTDTTGVEYHWTRDTSRLSLTAERRYTLTVNWDTTEYTFRQSAYHDIRRNLSVSGSLSQSFLYDDNDVTVYNADVAANWYPVRGFWVRPNLSAFYRTTEPSTEERFVEVGVDMRWNWRRLSFEIRYDHTDHVTETSDRVDDTLFMEVRRRF